MEKSTDDLGCESFELDEKEREKERLYFVNRTSQLYERVHLSDKVTRCM